MKQIKLHARISAAVPHQKYRPRKNDGDDLQEVALPVKDACGKGRKRNPCVYAPYQDFAGRIAAPNVIFVTFAPRNFAKNGIFKVVYLLQNT